MWDRSGGWAGRVAAVSLRQRFHRDRSAAHAGAQAAARGLAAPPRAPAGAGIFLIRAVGRAARLPRAHGARTSLGRGRTRRGRAAARGAGVVLMEPSTSLAVVPAKAGTHIPEAGVIGPRLRVDESTFEQPITRICDL